MTKFKYNNLIYEIPEGIDIEVEVTEDAAARSTEIDFNFVEDGKWGEHIPLLGGTDEEGNRVPSWEDLGIKKLV